MATCSQVETIRLAMFYAFAFLIDLCSFLALLRLLTGRSERVPGVFNKSVLVLLFMTVQSMCSSGTGELHP